MKGIVIAGDRSGSGKTSISFALASLLSRRMEVQTFKVGMDYIDPSYLTGVTGRPCRNLDSFVMSSGEIRAIIDHSAKGADLLLVEGVRGLFEGAEAIGDAGSTASIARLLDLPVILVVNARSITRSAAAIVKGFLLFDPKIRIAGVILNNIHGQSHRDKAVTAIEHFCGIPVLGAVPRIEEMGLLMRHLGLVPFREGSVDRAFRNRIEQITGVVQEHLDPERFLACARDLPDPNPGREVSQIFPGSPPSPDTTVAVAYDEAFNFYYADLFDILAASGARVTRFSPLHDAFPDADGYVIGGGYPEIYLKELSENTAMREGFCRATAEGAPVYAECGGLMYLTSRMTLGAGWQGRETEESYPMCGAIPAETRMPARRVVSYVEGEALAGSPFGPGRFRGHEFHYSAVDAPPGSSFAYRLSRGGGIQGRLDGIVVNQTLASYTHLHPVPSRDTFVRFVQRCRERR